MIIPLLKCFVELRPEYEAALCDKINCLSAQGA